MTIKINVKKTDPCKEKQFNNIHYKLMCETSQKFGFKYEILGNNISKIITDIGEIFFYDFIAQDTSVASHYACSNKWITKYFLKKASINTPLGKIFTKNEKEKCLKWIEAINSPVAVKPVNSIHSKGIHLNIQDKESFNIGWDTALKYSDKILVEEMVKGDDHRLVLVGDKFVAATIKTPPTVTGDGESTIKELVDKKNLLRKQNPHTASKKPISFNYTIKEHLNKQNLTPESILPLDKKIIISPIPNISAGGEHRDITDNVHPEFIEIIKNVSKALPFQGHLAVDLLTEDITKPPDTQEWNILEVNESLSLPHNHYPLYGESRDVCSEVIKYHYEKLKEKKSIKDKKNIIAPIWDQDNLNYTTESIKRKVIYRSAWERNLKIVEVEKYFWYISDDKGNHHYFKYIMPDTISTVSQKLSSYKHLILKHLKRFNLNTPQEKSFLLNEKNKAWEYAKKLNTPVVVKPYVGTGGKGVFLNISNEKDFLSAVDNQGENRFLVQEYISGADYRILVIDGNFVSAHKRVPAYVIGDGKTTLKELIEKKNKTRQTNPYTATKLIRVSPTIKKELESKNITLETIIKKDTKIELQKVANVSQGGENEDITEFVHIKFQNIAKNILKSLPDMFLCGIDIQAEDLSKDPDLQKWAIIELNANPDFQMHHFPVKGPKRDVAGVLIDSLFKTDLNNIKKKSVKMILKGKVQGVGFRAWAKDQAYIHALDGTVKNKDHDKIEIIIKGMPNAVDDFIKKSKIGPKNSLVKLIQTQNNIKNVNSGFKIL